MIYFQIVMQILVDLFKNSDILGTSTKFIF